MGGRTKRRRSCGRRSATASRSSIGCSTKAPTRTRPAGSGGHVKGVTAFHLAAADDLVPIIERLQCAGANAGLTDALYNGTPASWARFYGHPELAARIDNDAA